MFKKVMYKKVKWYIFYFLGVIGKGFRKNLYFIFFVVILEISD